MVLLAICGRAEASLVGVFEVTDAWSSGYSAQITVHNTGSSDIVNWTGVLTIPSGSDSSFWSVTTTSTASPYAITPGQYTSTIPHGQTVVFGYNRTGSPVGPTLTINGQNVPMGSGGSVPPPTPGAPATPSLDVTANPTGGFDAAWQVDASSTTAASYQLLEDGQVYASGNAPAVASNKQSGTIHIGNRPYAAHLYQLALTNSVGTTASSVVAFESDGASPILIGALTSGGTSPDATEQARQLTVALNSTTNIPLSMLDGSAGAYTVATNNGTVVTPSLSGSTLTVRGIAPGRASVRITNTQTEESRWLGIRVKNADGTVPVMPAYLAVGSVSEDTDGDLTMWRGFGTGAMNRRVDARYIYLNGGPYSATATSWGGKPNNWYGETSQKGVRASGFARESLKLGMIPFFVWYNINGVDDGYDNDIGHAQNASFMQGYFTDLKRMCDLIKSEAPDETVGIVIEPDFLGYVAQTGADPTVLTARTDAAYTVGVLVHGTDPEFPNTVTGYVQAVNYLFHKNLPNAYFGWEFALWGQPGYGGYTGIQSGLARGLMHLTDYNGIRAGRPAIYREAVGETQWYMKAGVTSNGASFVSVDKYGLDAGGSDPDAAANPSGSEYFWNQTIWNNYLTFVQAMHDTSGLPVTLWQLPVGHINSSRLPNPQGGLFPDLVNDDLHYEDSAPAFFFGDTFDPKSNNQTGGTDRLTYFSGGDNPSSDADPLQNLTTAGNAITWKPKMTDTAAAGVNVALFGAGVYNSTKGTGNPPSDGGWWITAAQNYYLNGPVPLVNPNAGKLAFGASKYSVNENAGSITVHVVRSGGSTGAVSVVCGTSSGTAKSGTDYVGKSTTLSWATGDTAQKAFTVSIKDLGITDGSTKQFNLKLSSPGGAALGSIAASAITIKENDTASTTVKFGTSSYSVSQSAGSITVHVLRGGATAGTSSVTCTTSSGTARSGTDYTDKSQTLTWTPGDTSQKAFTVVIKNRGASGGNGLQFSLRLSAPSGAAMGSPATATITIH